LNAAEPPKSSWVGVIREVTRGENTKDGFVQPHIVSDLLRDLRCLWGVAGGWALDLFLNRVTRAHQDIEIAIFREDQLALHDHISSRGGSLEYVDNHQLFPWLANQTLRLPVHEIWCRIETGPLTRLEVLLNERAGDKFVFRRDARVVLSIDSAFIASKSGIRILAPEIVLLYKSKRATDIKEQTDYTNVLPALKSEQRRWLSESIAAIEPTHAWLPALARSDS
jgi:hypothetical protein